MNVKVLAGEESYLIDVKLNNTKNNYDKLDISTYEFGETPLYEIINDCNTSSLFSDKRLVIVKNFNLDLTEKDENLLKQYIENPNPDTELIITSYKSLDKRKKLTKYLESKTEYYNYDHKSDDELKSTVKNFLADANLSIDSQALDELIFRVDSSLTNLTKELEKIKYYKDKGSLITMEDIDLLVAYDINKRIFDLIEYVINKDKLHAVKLYNELKLYVDEMQLIGLITSNLRLSYLAKTLGRFCKNDEELASLLGVNTKRLYFIKKKMYLDLYPILERINKMDYMIKSGQMDKGIAFQLFLME